MTSTSASKNLTKLNNIIKPISPDKVTKTAKKAEQESPPIEAKSAKVVTSFASKGGVGKTTLIGNLGGALADMGQHVLLIDADHQGSLTSFYTRKHTSEDGFSKFITTQDYRGCVSITDVENLEIICNDDFEKRLGTWLKDSPASRSAALKIAIRPLLAIYDYILIDCKGEDVSGEIGELAVRASDILISPVSPDAIVVREFLNNALSIIDRLQPLDPLETANRIPVPHACIYRYIPNSKTHTDFMEHMRSNLRQQERDGKVICMTTEIPQTVAYNDAQSSSTRRPVHRIDNKPRPTQRIPTARQSMTDLAHELFPELVPLEPRISEKDPFPTRASTEPKKSELIETVSRELASTEAG